MTRRGWFAARPTPPGPKVRRAGAYIVKAAESLPRVPDRRPSAPLDPTTPNFADKALVAALLERRDR